MPDNLVIVESPAKAKTIRRYLGRNFQVVASMGHVRDLPKSQLGVDVSGDFTPKYITIRGRGPVVSELRDAAKKADRVYLATDPDREGEAISWHLAQLLHVDPEKPCRVTFNEITKDAIKEAFRHPRPIETNLVNAQQARRILDRIVGYELSPLLWRKVRKGLSAGRVQSVAVRLICDREEVVREFVPQEYWTIDARLGARPAQLTAAFYGTESGRMSIGSEAEVKKTVTELQSETYVVLDIKRGERRRAPAPPFTTSTLQQESFRKLGFAAKKTMRVAQGLYEGVEVPGEGAVGLITYMRTDSTRISDVARTAAADFIKAEYGDKYYEGRKFETQKNAQDAHEAIRPTDVARTPASLGGKLGRDELRLYRLIWERFVASQMSNAVYATETVEIGAGKYRFRASGQSVVFAGFTRVYTESADDSKDEKDTSLPKLEVRQELKLSKLEPKQHFTEPPPRYTDATLVKTLEELGIGRPSTYAAIIDTIVTRGYVAKEARRFVPTDLGELVVKLLKEHFREIIDVSFTADMEEQLDQIADGDEDWKEVLRAFYEPFHSTVEYAEKIMPAVEIPPEVTDEKCEICGRNLVVKEGRFGKFLACPGYPECKFTKPYLPDTGAKCPKCGGAIVERRSKKGRLFYGCKNYPSCDFVVWNRPTKETCPQCGTFLVEKTSRGKTVLTCGNPECGYHVEREEKPAEEG